MDQLPRYDQIFFELLFGIKSQTNTKSCYHSNKSCSVLLLIMKPLWDFFVIKWTMDDNTDLLSCYFVDLACCWLWPEAGSEAGYWHVLWGRLLCYIVHIRGAWQRKLHRVLLAGNITCIYDISTLMLWWQCGRVVNASGTSNLRIASCMGLNPIGGKPLFPWARNFTLIVQYWLVQGTDSRV